MEKFKNLVTTHKKSIIISFLVIIVLILLGTGIAYATTAIAQSSSIGAENAENFAFVDAGVDPVSAENVTSKFDFEYGQFVYEVEFIADGTEYEYIIKASDGTVLKKEMQIISIESTTISDDSNSESVEATENSTTDTTADVATDNSTSTSSTSDSTSSTNNSTSSTTTNSNKSSTSTNSSNSNSTSSSSTTNSNSSSMISLDTAKSKALADAGLSSSSVTYTKAKLDYDDGTAVYDIEFYTSTYEYEYEINAYTGAIYEKSAEPLETSTSSSTTTNSSYIGIDKAKSIATDKVGLSVSEVTFKKAKLEKDDGIMVYEIEFYKDGLEYEFTINATTGSIIEYDVDYDD